MASSLSYLGSLFSSLVPKKKKGNHVRQLDPTEIQNREENAFAEDSLGKVFKATYDNRPVAVTGLLCRLDSNGKGEFRREIDIWNQLEHPHILPLLGVCDAFDTAGAGPFIVSPFMPNGTLKAYLANKPSDADKIRIMSEVASGMAYLHDNDIIHGDISSRNVLLDEDCRAKISDYGLSRTKYTSSSNAYATHGQKPGSLQYMAPEMLNWKHPLGSSKETDVYAYGILFYEVTINGGAVWVTADAQPEPLDSDHIVLKVVNGDRPERKRPDLQLEISDDSVWSLIQECWRQEPRERPSLEQVVSRIKKLSSDDVSRAVTPPLLPDDASTTPAKSIAYSPISSAPSDNVITVMFSDPLVYRDTKQNIRPFLPRLNVELERDRIWNSLEEASRDIDLVFDSATRDRLISTMSKRCNCLHYSGNGHSDYLCLEDGSGGPDWLTVDDFKNLIKNASAAVPFRLVFVSACYSETVGNAFASAGVPHVVCCQQDHELKDAAAIAFTEQFYLALAFGNTVRESFEAGCKAAVRSTPIKSFEADFESAVQSTSMKSSEAGDEAVQSTSNLWKAEKEKKFMLLPLNGNHEVPVFNATPSAEWPSSSIREEELMVGQNFIQKDLPPYPPQFFMGREVEMYNVLKQLLDKRVVSVIGETGMGRSSLVSAVCHYINGRRSTFITVFERILFVRAKPYRKSNRFVDRAKGLLKLLDKDSINFADDEEGSGKVIEAVCEGLKGTKALIVFERIELLEDSQELNKFTALVSELRLKTKNVTVLMTNKKALELPSIEEHPIYLSPLNVESTVRLFAHLCPYLYTSSERKQFTDSLMLSKDKDDLLVGTTIPEEKFNMLGKGIPSEIINSAFRIEQDYLAKIMDGTLEPIIPLDLVPTEPISAPGLP